MDDNIRGSFRKIRGSASTRKRSRVAGQAEITSMLLLLVLSCSFANASDEYVIGGADWTKLIKLSFDPSTTYFDAAKIIASYYQARDATVFNDLPHREAEHRCDAYNSALSKEYATNAYRELMLNQAHQIAESMPKHFWRNAEQEKDWIFIAVLSSALGYAYATGEPPMCVCEPVDTPLTRSFCALIRPIGIRQDDDSIRPVNPDELSHWIDLPDR